MLFEKEKFENKDKVHQLREEFKTKKTYFDKMPVDVLVNLLEIAIAKIDSHVNDGESADCRDFKDTICDLGFIADDLFGELEEMIELDIFE